VDFRLSKRSDNRIDCTARSMALTWSSDAESQSMATRVLSGNASTISSSRFTANSGWR
jgi:hypothetical protein